MKCVWKYTFMNLLFEIKTYTPEESEMLFIKVSLCKFNFVIQLKTEHPNTSSA